MGQEVDYKTAKQSKESLQYAFRDRNKKELLGLYGFQG